MIPSLNIDDTDASTTDDEDQQHLNDVNNNTLGSVIAATQRRLEETDEDEEVMENNNDSKADEEDESIEVLYTQKDNEMLLYQHNLYIKKRQNKDRTVNWRCSFKGCNQTITTNAIDDFNIDRKSEGAHLHVAVNNIQVAIFRAKRRMRERVEAEVHVGLMTIYNEEIARMHEVFVDSEVQDIDIVAEIPKYDSLKNHFYKIRARGKLIETLT